MQQDDSQVYSGRAFLAALVVFIASLFLPGISFPALISSAAIVLVIGFIVAMGIAFENRKKIVDGEIRRYFSCLTSSTIT